MSAATLEAVPSVSAPTSASAAPASPVPSNGRPLRLAVAATVAAKRVAPWVAKGLAVRKRRVRDRADLDAARAEKSAWVKGYADALREVFDGPAVADACTDWAGRILPEYAPVGLFVEQFHEEMDHRLRRLQAVVDHLEDMAAEEAAAPATAGPASGAASSPSSPHDTAPAPAPGRDEPKAKSLNWARLFPTAEELSGRTSAAPESTIAAPTTVPAPTVVPTPPAPAIAASTIAGSAAVALQSVVKPTGLLLVRSADDAKAVGQFLADLAVAPRVVVTTDDDPADVEALTAGATPPTFALVWPPAGDDGATAARFTFQLGFLVGRLGAARVCLVRPSTEAAPNPPGVDAAIPTVTLDAHGGWQLPLARTLKRAGVQVDLNRLC